MLTVAGGVLAALAVTIAGTVVGADAAFERRIEGEVADLFASAVFVIDAAGDLTTMTAERYASVDGGYALQPWSTPITSYGMYDGVRVASNGVGVWGRDGGDFAYIRLHVDASYTELVDNAALVLIAVACGLLDRQIAAQARAFEQEGGFTERLYRTRTARRHTP